MRISVMQKGIFCPTGCELIIRKKEALTQPPATASVITMQPPLPHSMLPYQPPPAQVVARTSTAPSLPTPAPAKTSESSHPPLKCPMAGTFYRSPDQVGDKVQKGQVVCIIEAMKLMNEIERDGKPVSIDRVKLAPFLPLMHTPTRHIVRKLFHGDDRSAAILIKGAVVWADGFAIPIQARKHCL
ncbi:Biotin carboxyl carrier protein of acetyl-CoA carboxylase 2, chloroplastic [Vitis vinifera]|uniref:Biotin carboxyl carrier protein of acetyl-CoA carboxylase n=1 Tax=Vitis vinifera TaxID=29760 RepID=A0A438D4U3_VITVI|nr:Biotin carboxyl carrier protein of acetyl-CoA carboxylase 2, chloroplastic [Vitis vinifera]